MNKAERDYKIIELHKLGASSRKIAIDLFDKVSMKSTVNDVIARYRNKGLLTTKGEDLAKVDLEVFPKIVTSKTSKEGCTHIVLPDKQVRADTPKDFLTWIGKYIVDRKPDVIIDLGDFADMASLSSYDKGKKAAEGKRVTEDIQGAIEGMKVMLKPLYDLQQQELKDYGRIKYKPRMVLTLGNHENRITRHVNNYPELDGFLSTGSLRYKDFGWEVIPFLQPEIINGIGYVHFAANPFSGKPYGGSALNILQKVGTSMTVGHKQTLDIATRNLPTTGQQQWFLCAGACYTHDEHYKGPQGNHHWRGVIVKHDVCNGGYSPMFVTLDYLKKKFG
jgi:hypothetical protein